MKIEINTLEYKEYNTVNIMTEPVYSPPSSSSLGMTVDIRPMVEDVAQVLTKHIRSILTGVVEEYTIYKETHDTIMGLPCVRKLQERINHLEYGSGDSRQSMNHAAASRAENTDTNSREDEVAQLQSAIVELNRYIIALESKVDMKAVCSSKPENDEESIKLEIYEDENVDESMEADSFVVPTSTHKNVIISVPADDAAAEADDAEADPETEEETEEAEEEAKDAEEAEEETEEAEEEAKDAEEEAEDAEEETEEADEAEEAEDAEAEEAEEEAEDEAEDAEEETEEVEEDEAEEAEEAEAEAEAEAEEDEAEAEEETEEAEAEEEAEIEVSEVKIKGKMYFTTDAQNGIIYACVDDDVGDEVGVFKNGVAVFNKSKK